MNSFLIGLICFFDELARVSKVSNSLLNPEKCLSRALLLNFLRHRPRCMDPFSSSTFTISKSWIFPFDFPLLIKSSVIIFSDFFEKEK